MLMIRLQRVGRKNDPSFRVVLTDSRNSTKSGKLKEVLGNYNPRFGTPTLEKERIVEWMSKGVQLSDTMHNLLVKEGVIKGKKINVTKKKAVATPRGGAAPVAQAPAAPAPATETPEAAASSAESPVPESASETSSGETALKEEAAQS